jgi:hypothetical protein
MSLVLDMEIRQGKPRRPAVPREVRDRIGQMSRENPGAGTPRIHGELMKARHRRDEREQVPRPESEAAVPKWWTFLDNT